MRFSPDADARSLQYKASSRSARIRQVVFLLALLLVGLVISIFVVRYIDPPRIGSGKTGAVTTGAVKTGAVKTGAVERGAVTWPGQPSARIGGVPA